MFVNSSRNENETSLLEGSRLYNCIVSTKFWSKLLFWWEKWGFTLLSYINTFCGNQSLLFYQWARQEVFCCCYLWFLFHLYLFYLVRSDCISTYSWIFQDQQLYGSHKTIFYIIAKFASRLDFTTCSLLLAWKVLSSV